MKRSFFDLRDEGIDFAQKLRAVLSNGARNIPSPVNGQVLVHFDFIENLLPKFRFVTIDDHHGDKADIDHIQQVVIFKVFICQMVGNL